MSRRIITVITIARLMMALAVAAMTGSSYGAEWAPTKPVRFIVGFPPGGATDLVARILQPKLTASLGQQVIIDNRPGANGLLSMQITAHGEPDGHSFSMSHIGTLVVSPAIQRVGYDPIEGFTHLGMLVSLQNILVVHPGVPAQNLPEFLALAKSQPGKINYASSGIGSPGHLAIGLLEIMTGVSMNHVPYKGGGPAISDLIAGHIPAFIAVISTGVPHVRSGRVRALAVTGARRADAVPEAPTMAEAGVKGYEAVNWYGLSAPPKLPAVIVRRLNQDFQAALSAPDVVQQLKDRGIDAAYSTGAEYRDYIRSEQKRWGPVIKASKLEPG
jgi:tripartite-type tricarboxylate transporter receptor subunit TctC